MFRIFLCVFRPQSLCSECSTVWASAKPCVQIEINSRTQSSSKSHFQLNKLEYSQKPRANQVLLYIVKYSCVFPRTLVRINLRQLLQIYSRPVPNFSTRGENRRQCCQGERDAADANTDPVSDTLVRRGERTDVKWITWWGLWCAWSIQVNHRQCLVCLDLNSVAHKKDFVTKFAMVDWTNLCQSVTICSALIRVYISKRL